MKKIILFLFLFLLNNTLSSQIYTDDKIYSNFLNGDDMLLCVKNTNDDSTKTSFIFSWYNHEYKYINYSMTLFIGNAYEMNNWFNEVIDFTNFGIDNQSKLINGYLVGYWEILGSPLIEFRNKVGYHNITPSLFNKIYNKFKKYCIENNINYER